MKILDIGLIGLAGSGKDTIADIICAELNYKRASFAAALKQICFEMGWNGDKDAKGRKLLQDVGMAFRAYDDNIWVNKTSSHLDDQSTYVFTDVRFSNEAHYIKTSRNGIIIRVVRPELKLSETHQHISESGQKDIEADYNVINDGTIEDLRKLIINIITNKAL